MSRVTKGAAFYADMAIADGTAKASAVFMRDSLKRKWNRMEHIAIMLLTQKYIEVKQGVISREECLAEQKKILMRCEV